MNKYLLMILLLFSTLTVHATDQVLKRLDMALDSTEKYDAIKNKKIRNLYNLASSAKSLTARYHAYINLYASYESYKYDSASVYADKAMGVAIKLANPDCLVEAACAKVFCLLSAGLYKEAFDEVGKIDISRATASFKEKFYFVRWRLLADIADYSHAEPYMSDYIRQSHALVDTLCQYMNPHSTSYNYIKGMQLMKERKCNESEYHFLQVLKDKDISMHERAISLSCLGWLYKLKGDEKKSLDYLVEAAICDIKSSTKETTALREVGATLYAQGDVDHAIEYVQKSLDDANFYNARQRKIEIGNVLPIIQQSRYKDMKTQRNVMILCIIMACSLLLVSVMGTLFIKKQMKKLRQAARIIEERNSKLEMANAQLSEANKIKTEYIGKSFYVSAGYFEKIEKLYRMVDRKIAARQYEDLQRSLSERSLMQERKNMYADFDETFLRLFPDFIEKYNALFDEKDQKNLGENKMLTNEMRIFALIRLGVADSERIAHFLNYSVNTINTYKTRVKNKSIVNNEAFEQRIMEI